MLDAGLDSPIQNTVYIYKQMYIGNSQILYGYMVYFAMYKYVGSLFWIKLV